MRVRSGTLTRVRAAVAEAQAEEEFWHQHYDEFARLYPDEFVAVVGGKVVAHSRDREGLAAAERAQGIDPRRVWVRFMATSPDQVLLAA